jgi:two-component system sensor histidine kinase and response regulator WspE
MNEYSKLDLFRQEAETQVALLKQVLPVLKTQSGSMSDLEQATQATHSIWGTARIVNLEATANLAQVMKDCFLAAQNQTVILGEEQIDVLLHAGDLILGMSKAAGTDFERWMTDHSWDLSTTQKAIATLIGASGTVSSNSAPAIVPPTPKPAAPKPEPVIAPPEPPQPTVTAAPVIPASTESLPPIVFNIDDESMFDLFRMEVESQVVVMNESLLALEENPQSAQALETLMRAAHSIKGSARIVSLDMVVTLAHVMEDCFVAAQHKSITLNPDHVDVLLQSVDLLQGVSETSNANLSQWLMDHQARFAGLRSTIEGILSPSAAPTAPIPPKPEPAIAPVHHPDIGHDNESVNDSDSQSSHGAVNGNAPAPKQTPEPAIAKTGTAVAVKERPESSAVSDQAAQDRVVRVSAENLNRIMGLAGESLIEANWLQPYADSMMSLKRRLVDLSRALEQLQESLDPDAPPQESKERLEVARSRGQECLDFLGDRLTELELYAQRTANLSDRLYREVISSHMRPFADGVQGFPRMIRDLARKLGKQVNLEITGKATAVDRDILKKLEAPLTHILRNATDHGLELPEERIAAGKSPEGTIRLEAFHRGGMLAITIADDGKGINVEGLRQKVINKNLATPEMAAQMSDAELIEFLFLPGFSTAKQVTEISGRGVGLDIAKSMAQEVGGTVRAMSQPGKGTSFHFQLPLTLSVVRTLLVEISGKPYAIPLARIDQIVTVERTSISDVENREYFTLNQQNIGLIAANQILELPDAPPTTGSLSVVVVSDQSNPYGLVVDKFLGERDLVVRPLDPRLGKVPDISATSLLSDGSPILIVDVSDMVRSIDTLLTEGRLTKVASSPQEIITDKRKKVLVVDDSITVREMERKLLENRGYKVEIAVNGMEGWNAVRTTHYDLVVSDIDMPRMNGIELVKQIKSHPRLRTTPVIIVSYRDRQEDRVQGLEAGADYYLTKSSFHDDTLINAVIDLIGRS